MKRKFLVLFLIVLLSGIGIFALEKNYSVITEFKYVDIATSKAFDNCLQNVCSDPNLYYFEDISGVKAGCVSPASVLPPCRIPSVLGFIFSFLDDF